jgi:hypothetical protein
VFVLASILVPKLLLNMDLHDVLLTVVLIGAAFAARLMVLFILLPPLSFFQPDRANQHAVQAGDRLGRASRRTDFGAGVGGYREPGLEPTDTTFCRRSCDGNGFVHAVGERDDIAAGNPASRPQSPVIA